MTASYVLVIVATVLLTGVWLRGMHLKQMHEREDAVMQAYLLHKFQEAIFAELVVTPTWEEAVLAKLEQQFEKPIRL